MYFELVNVLSFVTLQLNVNIPLNIISKETIGEVETLQKE